MFGLDILQSIFKTNNLYACFLKVYPIATKCPDLEYGDKIILPENAIAYINGTTAQYPLMFKLLHDKNATYCSVSEFSATPGMCYIPRWIMRKLGVIPGETIEVRNINIRKASFVKFRFRDGSFGNFSNPRAILENKLKAFSVVARHDRIVIEHLGKEYHIDIVDCQPDIVVDIVETDVEVDIEYAEDKNKPIIPESSNEDSFSITGPAESISESNDMKPLKSGPINKFRAQKNYFEGTAHSLRKTTSETIKPKHSGFHHDTSIAKSQTCPIESRFTEQDKENHFKGTAHKLC